MARAFVIRPFDTKKDSAGNVIDFERVHEKLVGPALEACQISGSTTGEIVEPGNIREDMFGLIIEADVVVCDISFHNANVFYELGIRHSLRKKRTVLIKAKPTADQIPFDLLTDRYVPYIAAEPERALPALTECIHASLVSERETDSPIFKMLPMLAETDPATVQVVPLQRREAIQRALAEKSQESLRRLAIEVRKERSATPTTLMIADALWKLKDYEAARDSFEFVRETSALDPISNLALANIYERLYRVNRTPELMASSDQAISRVLRNGFAAQKDRIEAFALRARNAKTVWRGRIEELQGLEKRRKAAMDHFLRECYEAYAEAFQADLNHYWSGLATMQMGTIFLDLCRDEGWSSSFDSEEEANAYRQRVQTAVAELKIVVQTSIYRSLKLLPKDHSDRPWAEVSEADLLFLTRDDAARVIAKYIAALRDKQPFVQSSALEQIELFRSLGVRAELASAVIPEIEKLVT